MNSGAQPTARYSGLVNVITYSSTRYSSLFTPTYDALLNFRQNALAEKPHVPGILPIVRRLECQQCSVSVRYCVALPVAPGLLGRMA